RSLLCDLARCVLERAGISIGDHHVAARAREPTRDSAPDSDARAGDERALPGETEIDHAGSSTTVSMACVRRLTPAPARLSPLPERAARRSGTPPPQRRAGGDG